MPLSEFEIIEKYFKPLSCIESAFLGDDVAALSSEDLIFSTDTVIEAVHFFADDPADQIAQKLLRANVSDIIAKGAHPIGYSLACSFSPAVDEGWIRLFSDGLAVDQKNFGMKLLGGDTTVLPNAEAPQVFTVTIFGARINTTHHIQRSGATPGDVLVVTGEIGNSGLGLRALKKGEERAKIVDDYRVPKIPFGVQDIIAKYATASVDISDGLLADVNHIANSSDVEIAIALENVPISFDASRYVDEHGAKIGLLDLASFGDDYQSAFTVSPEHLDLALEDAKSRGLKLTKIGSVQQGKKKELTVYLNEQPLDLSGTKIGYKHFE